MIEFSNITLGVIFGVFAMIGYGLNNAISLVPVRKYGPYLTLFYRALFTVFFMLVICLIFSSQLIFNYKYIIIALIMSFFGYIPVIAFYKGIEVGKIGIIAPIANSSLVFTVLFSIVFFGESFVFLQYIAVILILIGIILFYFPNLILEINH